MQGAAVLCNLDNCVKFALLLCAARAMWVAAVLLPTLASRSLVARLEEGPWGQVSAKFLSQVPRPQTSSTIGSASNLSRESRTCNPIEIIHLKQ